MFLLLKIFIEKQKLTVYLKSSKFWKSERTLKISEPWSRAGKVGGTQRLGLRGHYLIKEHQPGTHCAPAGLLSSKNGSDLCLTH